MLIVRKVADGATEAIVYSAQYRRVAVKMLGSRGRGGYRTGSLPPALRAHAYAAAFRRSACAA